MREITTHVMDPGNDKLRITVEDEPGAGGASHVYAIRFPARPEQNAARGPHIIRFQDGPIAEAGVNGLTQEVLLAIVIDRLECFQAGPFASPHNAEALAATRHALDTLLARTRERMARGVEGKSVA